MLPQKSDFRVPHNQFAVHKRNQNKNKKKNVQLNSELQCIVTFYVLVPTMGFEPATSHTSIPQYTFYKFKHHDHYTTNTLLG